MGYYVDFGDGLSLPELIEIKETLRQERTDLREITLGTETFGLLPYGTFPYTLTLTNKIMDIKIARSMQPNCYVQFSSEGLWRYGEDGITGRFRTWLNSIGATLLRPESVSRVDFAFDFDLPVVDFGPGDFVTRADKDAQWREHGRLQTLQFGTGDCVLRVYDKIAEIEQASRKAWFFKLWGQDQDVWRVEFQLRGARLKTAGIRTIADLDEFSGDLLRELSNKFARLCIPSQDQNRARWPLHPLWESLQLGISQLKQHGLVSDIATKNCLSLRLHDQGKMVLGHLKGIATILQELKEREESYSLKELLEELPSILASHHHETEWTLGVQERLQKLRLGRW
ncbi:MAG: hypothetical protein RIF37_15300 [Rhodospirillaceae bacterium]